MGCYFKQDVSLFNLHLALWTNVSWDLKRCNHAMVQTPAFLASTIYSNQYTVYLFSSCQVFFSRRFVIIQVVRPYSWTDIRAASKNSRFILSERLYFNIVGNQSVAIPILPIKMLTWLREDEKLRRSLWICLVLGGVRGIKRHTWYNGYRRRKWNRWFEFETWTRLFAYHITLRLFEIVCIQLFSWLWVNSRADWTL